MTLDWFSPRGNLHNAVEVIARVEMCGCLKGHAKVAEEKSSFESTCRANFKWRSTYIGEPHTISMHVEKTASPCHLAGRLYESMTACIYVQNQIVSGRL